MRPVRSWQYSDRIFPEPNTIAHTMRRWAWGLAGVALALGAALVAREILSRRVDPGDPRVRQALYDLLQPVALANCDLQRFGEPHDGGYLMCGNLLGEVAAGYSYGIGGYDQWGCDISTRLGVTVHQYDCFDTRQPACPAGRTVFHAECVGDPARREGGRATGTLARQIADNGDTGRRLVVKMDVEGSEWESLLFAPDDVLQQIDQLALEIHYPGQDRHLAVAQRLRQHFHVAHVHVNNWSCVDGFAPFPAWAIEVLFVSRRLAVEVPGRPVRLPHPLDAPNRPGAPDCPATLPSP